MKTCPNCGTVLDDSAAFCAQCGTPVPAGASQPTAGHTPEQAAELPAEQAQNQVPEQAAEQAPEQAVEQMTAQASEQTAEQAPEQAVEQMTAQASEQTAEQTTEQTAAGLPEETTVQMAEPTAGTVEKPAEMKAAEQAFCAACGAALDKDDAFCQECGMPTAPNAAPPVQATAKPPAQQAPVYQQQTYSQPGYSQPASATATAVRPAPPAAPPAAPGGVPPVKTKKSPVKAIMIAAVAVVVIAAAVVAGLFLLKPSAKEQLLYLKDDQLNLTGLKKIAPFQVTEELYKNGDSTDSYMYPYINFSSDGKYMFYPENMSGDDSTLDLYYINLKANNAKKSTATQIDSDVSSYRIAQDGSRVFYVKSEKLYVFDFKDKTKIASDVSDFIITDDGLKLLYDSSGTIYLKDMKAGGDAEKIDSDATVQGASRDLSKIYYMKNDDLYVKEAGKDKKKIDSGVDNTLTTYDTGEVYYTKSDSKQVPLSDYVTDDMTSDAMLEEPSFSDYYGTDSDGYFYFDSDAYSAAYDAYYAKLDRDELRSELQNNTYTATNTTLYYYNGTDPVKVTDSYNTYMAFGSDKAMAAYLTYRTADVPKMNLSQLSSYYDVQNALDTAYNSGSDAYIAIGSKETEIDVQSAQSFQFNKDGTTVYYSDSINSDSNTGDLYTAAISGDTVGTPEKYAEDVYYYFITYDTGALVYFKDVDSDNYCGDLYINKDKVDSDVYCYGVQSVGDKVSLLYRSDYDAEDYTGTLKKYDGKNSVEIADDVYNYVWGKNGTIAYIADYDGDTGTAYLYTGGKQPKLIDNDVAYLITLN